MLSELLGGWGGAADGSAGPSKLWKGLNRKQVCQPVPARSSCPLAVSHPLWDPTYPEDLSYTSSKPRIETLREFLDMQPMREQPVSLPARFLVPGQCDPIESPVETKDQLLPLHQLSFENLQRLAVRFLSADKRTIHCQEYGIAGQAQQGIDLYARLSGRSKDEVWQCKRYQQIGASDVEAAVTKFLDGTLVSGVERFVIVTSAVTEGVNLANAEREAAGRLQLQGVEFALLGRVQLSALLKDHPKLVDDFFGREWVRCFCGSGMANELGERLSREDVVEFRTRMGSLYEAVFDSNDAYVRSAFQAESVSSVALSLVSRWVMPNISSKDGYHPPQYEAPSKGPDQKSEDPKESKEQSSKTHDVLQAKFDQLSLELSVDSFLSDSHRAIVLGDPGSGKSAMLRMVALDLLSENPSLEKTANRFGDWLPVWLPFAFLSQHLKQGGTLVEAALAWLKRHSGDLSLEQLVLRALLDDRLLLLIDGLDEWSDIEDARSCITSILGFLSLRNSACFTTARPLGYQRLDRLPMGWKHGTLLDLTRQQQHQLAFRLIRSFANQESQDDATSRLTTENFVRRLGQDESFDRMTGTPLLLIGMVSLFLRNQSLPHSRYTVCDELIREILINHPSRRTAASYLSASPFSANLSPEDLRAAIARLAMATHQSEDSTTISRNDAETEIVAHFETEGVTRAKAREYARLILPSSSHVVGILSEVSSSGDVSFIHRTFQEYLAAEYLHGCSLEEQEDMCRRHVGHQAWRQVILFLLQHSSRSHETRSLIDALNAPDLNVAEMASRRLLVAEAIFSNIKLDATYRAAVATEILAEIEAGPWLPMREWLLSSALIAPQGSNVRELLVERLRGWATMPESLHWGRDLCDAIRQWPEDPIAEEILWRLLHHEEKFVQIEAALALGSRVNGSMEWRQRLLTELGSPRDGEDQAVYVLCLAEGWHSDRKVSDLLWRGLDSDIPEIRFASIYGIVLSDKGDARAKSVFMNMDVPIWFGDLAGKIVELGWPGSPEIRDLILRSLDPEPHRRQHRWMTGQAWRTLIDSFPRDPQVAKLLAAILEVQEDRISLFQYDYPLELVEQYSGFEDVQDAASAWLERHSNSDDSYSSSIVAGLARTPIAKAMLLERASSASSIKAYHAFRSLIAAWGAKDKEVQAALLSVSPHEPRFSILAATLVKAIDDPEHWLNMIMDHLDSDQSNVRFNVLIEAVRLIRDSGVEIEPIEEPLITRFLASVEVEQLGESETGAIVELFPHHPQIRLLAQGWQNERSCRWSSIARAYGSEAQVRLAIDAVTRFLPEPLRIIIAIHCRQHALNDGQLGEIAGRFKLEHSTDVRIINAVGVAETALVRGENTEGLIEYFIKEAAATGPDYNTRRQSAIAGLISLKRLDKVTSGAKPGIGVAPIHFGYSLSNRQLLPVHVVRNWDYIQSLGDRDWLRSVFGRTELSQLLNAARYLDNDPLVALFSTELYEQAAEGDRSLEMKARERAEGWVEDCLRVMGLSQDGSLRGINVADCNHAIDLLVKYGAGNEFIQMSLEGFVSRNVRWWENAGKALSKGWQSSSVLRTVWDHVEENNPDFSDLPYWLVSVFADTQQFVSWVLSWIGNIAHAGHFGDLPEERWFVMRRAFRDSKVGEELMKVLLNKPTVHEIGTLPWLVRGNSSMASASALEEWAEEEIKIERSLAFPRFGFDAFKVEKVSLYCALLDIVLTDKSYSISGPG